MSHMTLGRIKPDIYFKTFYSLTKFIYLFIHGQAKDVNLCIAASDSAMLSFKNLRGFCPSSVSEGLWLVFPHPFFRTTPAQKKKKIPLKFREESPSAVCLSTAKVLLKRWRMVNPRHAETPRRRDWHLKIRTQDEKV